MGKRHPNHRLVKIHRNYTVDEIARLLGMHKNTIRRWVKDGLSVIDDKRPMLILGLDLIEFIKNRRVKNKQKCKPGELYCVRCRLPKYPAGNMADYSPVNEKFGNLKAICPDCEAIMNQRVSLATIIKILGKMDITLPEELRHMIEITKPSVNSDIKQGA